MNKKTLPAALGAALLAALAGCGPKPPEADLQNLTAAMNAYLAKKGDLCLGKTRWPIDVPQREAGTRARNALQMPVLERLGLVSASKATIKDDKEQEAGDDDDDAFHGRVIPSAAVSQSTAASRPANGDWAIAGLLPAA